MCVDIVFILTQNVLFFKKNSLTLYFFSIGQLLVKKNNKYLKNDLLCFIRFLRRYEIGLQSYRFLIFVVGSEKN